MIQPPDSPADPDLDNTEPCEAFTFDDSTLEHIMDTYSPSYSINKTHIYHVSKHSSSHYGSLIDRGANGGLAGSDVRILERTGRTVSVTGIDNHELPGLDIVTCAALLHTNNGKVVLIMHEYAYYGRGNTIHSPGQIEWFQNTCDDKSFHVGGKQVINFLDGYSTPLQCRTGLMYMSLLGKPTDADLNTYPHVLLTGPHEWDPSVLDYTHPTTSGDPTWAPDPSLLGDHDPRIDEFGNFKGRVQHTLISHLAQHNQNQNPAEGRYCTLKSLTNTIMNRSGAPADCWLLCMIHASYILNHLSSEALGGNVPLGMLYGVSPDIIILLLYTFYQPVFYATHNQSYPSASEERAARWVGFGEHVGDALTHKLLDDDTKKILYRSAVRPSDSAHPNKCLVSEGGESSQTPKPIVFVRSRQDNSQSVTKPMAEYNPDDLIGRTFLLPKNEQGERLRATIKRKVIETSKLLDDQHDNAIDKINFHLDVGQGRAEAIMSYVQILDHLDQQEQQEELYKFRAITGHQGPLSPQDENYKGSKYNVMVERETGEITDEPSP